jgi:hypothetical protein
VLAGAAIERKIVLKVLTKIQNVSSSQQTVSGTDESPTLAKVLHIEFDDLNTQTTNNKNDDDVDDDTQTREAEMTKSKGKSAPDQRRKEQNAKDWRGSGNAEPESGDLLGAIISDADRMMNKEVYGDHVHQNPGVYLNGEITDDRKLQD